MEILALVCGGADSDRRDYSTINVPQGVTITWKEVSQPAGVQFENINGYKYGKLTTNGSSISFVDLGDNTYRYTTTETVTIYLIATGYSAQGVIGSVSLVSLKMPNGEDYN